MTVSASATITYGISGTPTTTYYPLPFAWIATDGTNVYNNQVLPQVPVSYGAKKADRFIREAIAAAIFGNCGLTIDPEDIYIPFS